MANVIASNPCINIHVGALSANYESEGEGKGEPQTPMPGLYSREASRHCIEREGAGSDD
ncbi:hypothetical protein B0H14DRAFT_3540625 [Mycena olivaceomarginata]|nr:hypothetical protein B0H14DRAFT_3540625 [Mycena olivaceomarginata]